MSTSTSNFRIANCWSKAGVGTCIILSFGHPKSAKIALDLGATPTFCDAVSASVVLLSHGHIDHIGAIFSHARAHSLSYNGSIPTYYMPMQILHLVKAAQDAMTALNSAGDRLGGDLTMNLIGVEPGNQILLPLPKHVRGTGMNVIANVFATSHAGCPAVGYVLSTKWTRQVLKAEYANLDEKTIRDLVRSGISVKGEMVEENFEIMYTGDTTIDAIQENGALWSGCHTIFCEATFLDATDKSRQLARDRGHMHIDDVLLLLKDTGENQNVVLIHVSNRYTAQQALDLLVGTIPQQFVNRVMLAVNSLHGAAQFRKIVHSGVVKLSAYIDNVSRH